MRRQRLLWIGLASVVTGGFTAGCNSGPGNFDGNVSGDSLDVKEAIFLTQPITDGTNSLGSGIGVLMSDQTGTCDRLKNNQVKANTTGLGIVLGVSQNNLMLSANVTPGSYRLLSAADLINPPGAGVKLSVPVFDKLDAQCKGTLNTAGEATAGSVTVDSYTAGKSITGHFDLDFSSTEATGDFNATFCDFQVTSNSNTPACE